MSKRANVVLCKSKTGFLKHNETQRMKGSYILT